MRVAVAEDGAVRRTKRRECEAVGGGAGGHPEGADVGFEQIRECAVEALAPLVSVIGGVHPVGGGDRFQHFGVGRRGIVGEEAHRGPNGGGVAKRQCEEMVLPVRIELTTSALPRMRSTTELRQHFVRERRAYADHPQPRQPAVRLASSQQARHVAQMTGKDKEREERLAAALRDNLRKRKSQSREIKEKDESGKD